MKKIILIAAILGATVISVPKAQVGYSSNIGTSLSGGGGGASGGAGTCPAGQVVTVVNIGSAPTCSDNITPGTITTDNPFEFSQTWNAAGVTFNGLAINITPTASDTGSRLFAINQVGEGLGFSIYQNAASGVLGKLGLAMNQGTEGTANSNRFVIHPDGAGHILFDVAPNNPGTRTLIASGFYATENSTSSPTTRVSGTGFFGSSNTTVAFSNTPDDSFGTTDTGLSRIAAASVASGNGTAGDFTGNFVGTVLQTKTIFTVGTLPTCNGTAEGSRASVSDASTPVFLATVAGSGAVHIGVYCNGSNWIVQ